MKKFNSDYQGIVLRTLIENGSLDVDRICDWIIKNKFIVKKDDLKANNITRNGEEKIRQRIRNHLRTERPLIMKGYVKVASGKYTITSKGKSHFLGTYSNSSKVKAVENKIAVTNLEDKYPLLLKQWYDQGVKQFIFEGPPGTGKTRLAKAIIDDGILTDEDQPTDFLNQLNRYATFVQFHPSYSYEDFVEGLRPLTSTKGDLLFNIKRGPFSLACSRSINAAVVGIVVDCKINFELHKIQHLISLDPEQLEIVILGDNKITRIPTVEFNITGSSASIMLDKYKDLLVGAKVVARINDPLCNLSTTKEDYVETSHLDYELLSSSSQELKDVWLLDAELTVVGSGQLELSTGKIASKFLFGDLVSGGECLFVQPKEVHYFIIDEINRANSAEVFGELLVQLEYRLGSENSIPVRLPYSGDLMLIPDNLVVLGTMNNADRSLLKLDRALLRRFHIVTIAPDPQVLSGINIDGIPMDQLLSKLNSEVSRIFGHDLAHQIGHSYFTKLKNGKLEDLKRIWYFEIFPLVFDFAGGDVELILNSRLFPGLELTASNIHAHIKTSNLDFKKSLIAFCRTEGQTKGAA